MKKLACLLYVSFIISSARAMIPGHRPLISLSQLRNRSTASYPSIVSKAAHTLLGINPNLLENNLQKTSAHNNYVKQTISKANQEIRLHHIQPDTVYVARKTLTDHHISPDEINTKITERGCYDLVGSLFVDAMVHTTNEESRKLYRETYHQQNKGSLQEPNTRLMKVINSIAEKTGVPITSEQVFFSNKNINATIIGDFIVVQPPATVLEMPLFSFIVGHELAHIKQQDYMRTSISKLLLKLGIISEQQFFEWQRDKEKNADLYSAQKLKCARAILPSLIRGCNVFHGLIPHKHDHHPTDLQQIRYIIEMAEKEESHEPFDE